MNKEKLQQLAEKWIKAWNDRDHVSLRSMFKEDSTFAQMGSRFNPIFKNEQALIPNLWIDAWLTQKLKIVQDLNLTFTTENIKTGDTFVQVKSKLSDGTFIVDYLRFDDDDKIDQILRNYDKVQWDDII